MSLVVLKFGGTSVASPESRFLAYNHVKREIETGNQPVIVVSAMGRKGSPYATDTLLSLVSKNADPAIKDLIVSCGETVSACIFADELNQSGISASALTGATAGIKSTGEFGCAQIDSMDVAFVKRTFLENKIPVITGFQGLNKEGWITTIGRGGSDISAVAIGGFLAAERVDIYTDVPGIAKADPRIIPSASFLTVINSLDMLELSSWGAGVIHPKAVSAFMGSGVPTLRIRSTFDTSEGTSIINHRVSDSPFSGMAVLKNLKEDSQGIFLLGESHFSQDIAGTYAIITAISNNMKKKNLNNILDSELVIKSICEERKLQLLTKMEVFDKLAEIVYQTLDE